MSNSPNVRTDAENRRMLDQLAPTFERLRADRIRSESDVERYTREVAEAEKAAVEELGTSSDTDITTMVTEARAANTVAVDTFSSSMKAVQDGLQRLGSGS